MSANDIAVEDRLEGNPVDVLSRRVAQLSAESQKTKRELTHAIRELIQVSRDETKIDYDRDSQDGLWHCKRCGYNWRGYRIGHVPECCARCHTRHWGTAPRKPRKTRSDLVRPRNWEREPDLPPGEQPVPEIAAINSGLPPPPPRPVMEGWVEIDGVLYPARREEPASEQ